MKEDLRLSRIANIRDGRSGEEWPAWYEVEGLPNGQKALIESEGRPTNRWRIKRMPSDDRDKARNFATPEEALAALQQELR